MHHYVMYHTVYHISYSLIRSPLLLYFTSHPPYLVQPATGTACLENNPYPERRTQHHSGQCPPISRLHPCSPLRRPSSASTRPPSRVAPAPPPFLRALPLARARPPTRRPTSRATSATRRALPPPQAPRTRQARRLRGSAGASCTTARAAGGRGTTCARAPTRRATRPVERSMRCMALRRRGRGCARMDGTDSVVDGVESRGITPGRVRCGQPRGVRCAQERQDCRVAPVRVEAFWVLH